MNAENLDLSEIKLLRQKKKHYEDRIARLRITPGIIFIISALAAVGAISYCLYSVSLYDSLTTENLISRVIPITLGSVVAAILATLYLGVFLSTNIRMHLRDIEFQLAKYDNEELQSNIEEDFFNKLVKINFKYIDQYYLQTQQQADKSFRLTLAACFIGLSIIGTGIVMMFLDKTEPAYVTTAAGVISEFIAAVFFYLYNRTVQKMSQYHHKLVITQNISLALKISQELAEPERSQAQNKLIDKLTENVNSLLAKSD